ncbi:MAG: 4Fe-4S dicluster domain-containing protein [Bacteroidales bacterium]|nr:4Fe-4S dicluster domain-containing protein [Bacteroidales bacterium]
MLRKIRIALAAVFFIAITLMFLDFTGTLHAWFSWMAKLQFLPAVLAANVGVIVLLCVVTLVFGRCYCSVICPLGVYQDIVSNLSGRRKGKKMRFTPSKEMKWLRYGVWALFVVAVIAGIHALVGLLAPYSTYGRFVQSVLAPLYQWGNNFFAWIARRAGGYAFYPKEVWLKSLPTLLAVVAMMVVITVLAWKNGRTYCNTVCPVGTTLSFLSRFAMFRPVIDTAKCKDCHACEKKCKAACIDIAAHKVDYSRCVDCFDCIDNCKFDAMKYRFAWGKQIPSPAAQVRNDNASAEVRNDSAEGAAEGAGRRAFVATSAFVLGSAALRAQEKKLDGGLADLVAKKQPERATRVVPFGSKSVKDFYKRCTACQLCVSACPNNVLRPSSDLAYFMQPEMSFERGYCRPECVKCSEVCPAGAIERITPEEKTALHVGVASVQRELCIVNRDGVQCNNCARHCPAGAIMMVPKEPGNPDSLMIPTVNESLCIGCGACENLCPSNPISAIRVNGLEQHIRN